MVSTSSTLMIKNAGGSVLMREFSEYGQHVKGGKTSQ